MAKIKDKIAYCDEVMATYIKTGDPFVKPAMPNPFEDERKIDIITFLYMYCTIWRQFAILALNLFAEKENVPDYPYLILKDQSISMVRLCKICKLPLVDDIVFHYCGNGRLAINFLYYRQQMRRALDVERLKESYEAAGNAFKKYKEQATKALEQEESE